MRKLLIAAAVTAVALTITAVALAATTHNFKMSFTPKDPGAYNQNAASPKYGLPAHIEKAHGKPAGAFFHSNSNDASNPNNQQPANLKEQDIILPPGAKINTGVIPVCKASDTALETQGPAACPAKTQVGHYKGGCTGAGRFKACSGKATARLPYNKGGDVTVRVYAFNGPKNTLVLALFSSVKNFVIRAKVTVTKNPVKIIAKVPVNCVLATTAPPNCGPHHETARLDKLELQIDRVVKNGKGFLVTPTKCPSSKTWLFKATYKYYPNSLNTTANGTNTQNEPPHHASDTKTWKAPCK